MRLKIPLKVFPNICPINGKFCLVYSTKDLIASCPADDCAQELKACPIRLNPAAAQSASGASCVRTLTTPLPKLPAALSILLNILTPVVPIIWKNFCAT